MTNVRLIGKKTLALLLTLIMVFALTSFTEVHAAKTVRSAEKVLTELISVKKNWENTTNKTTRTKLTKQADNLRTELLETKEYKNNIKVSSRNFLVEKGKDPGFKKLVDELVIKNGTRQNCESVLDYIKAYNKSFWGTVCIISGGIILVGTLVYAVAPKIVAGVGYTVAKWKAAVATAMSSIEANRIGHIMKAKHNWDVAVGSSPTWAKVKPILEKVLLYGKSITYKEYPAKEMDFGNYIVQVQYNIVNGVVTVVDSWVNLK